MDEKKLPVAAILAVAITTGFFALLFMMAVHPERNHDALEVLLGSLGGGWGAIIGYYFGSSAGSRAKTDWLERMDGKTTPATTPALGAPPVLK